MVSTASINLPHIPGYSIFEQLYTGSKTAVYRALRDNQQHQVVIKVLQREYPNFSELVQFRNQYTMAKNLATSGIVHSRRADTLDKIERLYNRTRPVTILPDYQLSKCLYEGTRTEVYRSTQKNDRHLTGTSPYSTTHICA